MKKAIARMSWACCVVLPCATTWGQQISVDFERFPSGEAVGSETRLTDQWVGEGVVFVALGGYWTARTLQEGDYNTRNFGNSPITFCHVGNYCESTGIAFVDPATGLQSSTTSVSVLLGDGDSDSETFTVIVFDGLGNVLNEVTQSTSEFGYLYSFASDQPPIARVQIRLECGSGSGVVFDDLAFDQPPSLCWADFNRDGSVNTIDVLQFLNAWAAKSWAANIVADWDINTLDVLAFLNAWATGC